MRSHNRQKGMTFIEIMIVIAIIGGTVALGASLMFPGDNQKLDQASSRIAGTVKYLYNEAAVKNRYYRIVFDLDGGSYGIESSETPIFLSLSEEDSPTDVDVEPEKEELVEEGEVSSEKGETTKENEPQFSAEEGYLKKKVHLPKGIKFKDIFVIHHEEPQETGKVYVYFFPNGWVEPNTIHLASENEELIYSLEVNPLTGKTKIKDFYVEADYEAFKPKGP